MGKIVPVYCIPKMEKESDYYDIFSAMNVLHNVMRFFACLDFSKLQKKSVKKAILCAHSNHSYLLESSLS